jgi:hypothetical protein
MGLIHSMVFSSIAVEIVKRCVGEAQIHLFDPEASNPTWGLKA